MRPSTVERHEVKTCHRLTTKYPQLSAALNRTSWQSRLYVKSLTRSKLAQVVLLATCIREVSASNVCLNTDHPDWWLSVPPGNAEVVPNLGKDRFLPYHEHPNIQRYITTTANLSHRHHHYMNCQHTANAGRRCKEQLLGNAIHNSRAAHIFLYSFLLSFVFLSFTLSFDPFLSTFFLSTSPTVYFFSFLC
jgi:hypothetical protein